MVYRLYIESFINYLSYPFQVLEISSKLGAALQVGESNVWQQKQQQKPAAASAPPKPANLPKPASIPHPVNAPKTYAAQPADSDRLPKQPEKPTMAESKPEPFAPLMQPSAPPPTGAEMFYSEGDPKQPTTSGLMPKQPAGAHLPKVSPRSSEGASRTSEGQCADLFKGAFKGMN